MFVRGVWAAHRWMTSSDGADCSAPLKDRVRSAECDLAPLLTLLECCSMATHDPSEPLLYIIRKHILQTAPVALSPQYSGSRPVLCPHGHTAILPKLAGCMPDLEGRSARHTVVRADKEAPYFEFEKRGQGG